MQTILQETKINISIIKTAVRQWKMIIEKSVKSKYLNFKEY